MAIADDGLQYTQSVVLGLIVSFLLAKLFSIVFSSGDEIQNLSLSGTNPNNHQPDGISSETRRKSAEKDIQSDADFSKKHISSDSDDDWEGVETTELDEAFCAATGFVAAIAADRSEKKVSRNLQLKLYGLYKIATEGPCSVPQPSAIKITARAKWNAWHKLGSISPEEAMQKYLEIITELLPNWADGSTSYNSQKRGGGGNNETSSKDTRPMGPDFSSFMHDEESGDEFKLDAIHDFAREGDSDKLLKCIEDSEGQTPSHWAAGVAEMLSSRSADINLKDDEGETPLHDAAVCERDETLVKKNAATGREDDDGDYSSDSEWHSIQPPLKK